MNRIKKHLFIALAFGLTAILALYGALWFSQRAPELGGDFRLNHNGRIWIFSQNAKPLNLLYVGYAKCPDVCPMALSYAAQTLQELSPEEASQVQLIFISVDASHDTAESVATYARQFNPGFIGLTGSQPDIDKTIKLFGASYIVEENPKSYLGYSIAHTDRIFVLDRKGKVLDSISSPRSTDEIRIKIKEHL